MEDEKHDPHERPPSFIRDRYKWCQKLPQNVIESTPGILDLGRGFGPDERNAFKKKGSISAASLRTACYHLASEKGSDVNTIDEDVQIYEAREIPGLQVIPSLIPKETQIALLSKLLHRDLADQRHKTNVHLHHQIPYHAIGLQTPASSNLESEPSPISFFNIHPKSPEPFIPLDEKVHKCLTVSQFLNRKLRWVTLGGQYDWSQKKYSSENPTFPADLAAFTSNLFPDMKAEAAIVNVYTPGDTLSMHRDVSEECDKGLISISIGCDGLFVVGLGSGSERDEDPKSLTLRLRSGDAVFMSECARFAWHGIPQVLPNTCPEWLHTWPAGSISGGIKHDAYDPWRYWMSNKRINLNIRQMQS